MTVGDPSSFAIESEFVYAFEKLSWRGVGFFVIHLSGCCFGVKSPGATMLANSFDEVAMRLSHRGKHLAPFAKDQDALKIAAAYTDAIYLDRPRSSFFGMSEDQFTKIIYSNHLQWAPDGDEAFDDGSFVLQFDVDERVRLIGFKRPDQFVDEASVKDLWLSGNEFYGVLREWRDNFIAEWEGLPKR
jgi:hypothetical protein